MSTPGPFANVEKSNRPRPTGITFEVWGVRAPIYFNPATNTEDVYDAKTGNLYSTEAWGMVVLERIQAAAPELLEAAQRVVGIAWSVGSLAFDDAITKLQAVVDAAKGETP